MTNGSPLWLILKTSHGGQDVDPAAGTGYAALQRQLSEANAKVAALVTAVESGVAVEDLTAALRRRTAERDELKARLEQAERPRVMSAAQINELVEKWGGGLSSVLGAATGAERAEVYASLGGLRLDYDPHLRRVQATADLSRVAGCVRGGGLVRLRHGSWSGDWGGADRFNRAPVHIFFAQSRRRGARPSGGQPSVPDSSGIFRDRSRIEKSRQLAIAPTSSTKTA